MEYLLFFSFLFFVSDESWYYCLLLYIGHSSFPYTRNIVLKLADIFTHADSNKYDTDNVSMFFSVCLCGRVGIRVCVCVSVCQSMRSCCVYVCYFVTIDINGLVYNNLLRMIFWSLDWTFVQDQWIMIFAHRTGTSVSSKFEVRKAKCWYVSNSALLSVRDLAFHGWEKGTFFIQKAEIPIQIPFLPIVSMDIILNLLQSTVENIWQVWLSAIRWRV